MQSTYQFKKQTQVVEDCGREVDKAIYFENEGKETGEQNEEIRSEHNVPV